MKNRKTNEEAAALSAKDKVKIKTLKLTKETIETLSDQGAGAIKGGAPGATPYCMTGGRS